MVCHSRQGAIKTYRIPLYVVQLVELRLLDQNLESFGIMFLRCHRFNTTRTLNPKP